MSLPPYIVFTDLDGTLLDHRTYSAAPALERLNQLKSQAIPVIPVTSKTADEVDAICQNVELTQGFIVENGAAIYLPKSVYSTPIEGAQERKNYWVKTFAQSVEKWNIAVERIRKEHAFLFKTFSEMSPRYLSTISGLSVEKSEQALQREFILPIQWLGKVKQKDIFTQLIKDQGGQTLEGGRFLHVSDPCDKSIAAQWFTDFYRKKNQLKNTVTIGLGDSQNDKALLEWADWSVIIRSPVKPYLTLNKQNQVLKTERCGPEGWAQALKDIILKTKD